jgi:elongation factor 1-beta
MSIAEDKLQGYDKKLENNLFFKGPQPSNEDAEVLEELTKEKCVPDQEKFPNLFAWYSLVILFEDEVVATWKKPEQHQKGKKGKKEEKKDEKKEEKKEKKDDEIDEDDLFGDETEEDKKAKEEAHKKREEEKKEDGKKKKKVEVQKSLVLIDVKVYDPEQDYDALAEKILKNVKRDGLVWKTEYKLAEVAFGVKKIVMGMVVEDEKVSVDDIIDELTSWEDEIQSVDIVAFNKL